MSGAVGMLLLFLFATLLIPLASASEIPDKETIALYDARRMCRRQQRHQIERLRALGTPFCIQHADLRACWGPAPAGMTRYLACYLYKAKVSVNLSSNTSLTDRQIGPHERFIVRECDAHGRWKMEKSDFSRCESYQQFKRLRWLVSYTGYGLSLASLIIALGLFFYFKQLLSLRNKIHCHFAISIAMQIVCFILFVSYRKSIFEKSSVPVCYFFLALAYYSHLAKLSWLLMEGCYLVLVTVKTFSVKKLQLWNFGSWAWGLPIMTTVVWLFLERIRNSSQCDAHAKERSTHLDIADNYFLGFMLLSLLIDFGICIFIIVHLIKDALKRRRMRARRRAEEKGENLERRYSVQNKSETRPWLLYLPGGVPEPRSSQKTNSIQHLTLTTVQRKAMVAYLFLVPIITMSYVLWMMPWPEDRAFQMLFINVWAWQGLIVAVILCFLNHEVMIAVRDVFRQWRDRRRDLRHLRHGCRSASSCALAS